MSNVFGIANKNGTFAVWQEKSGHNRPKFFLTRVEAQADLDDMKHAEAKHLEIREYTPMPEPAPARPRPRPGHGVDGLP